MHEVSFTLTVRSQRWSFNLIEGGKKNVLTKADVIRDIIWLPHLKQTNKQNRIFKTNHQYNQSNVNGSVTVTVLMLLIGMYTEDLSVWVLSC